MQHESAGRMTTTERLVSQIALVGIALVLAILVALIMVQNTNAASPSYYQDGALMDAIAPDRPSALEKHLNFPHNARRDATRMQFHEDNWLLVDPVTSDANQHETRRSEWIRFIEENVLQPSAASRSAPVQQDIADHVAALRSDVLDSSLGIDHYRETGQNCNEADSADIAASVMDW